MRRVIRLTGLPSVARFPRAAVSRGEEGLSILFTGTGDTTLMEVPLERLGDDEDAESTELRLLADLQKMGYRVERTP